MDQRYKEDNTDCLSQRHNESSRQIIIKIAIAVHTVLHGNPPYLSLWATTAAFFKQYSYENPYMNRGRFPHWYLVKTWCWSPAANLPLSTTVASTSNWGACTDELVWAAHFRICTGQNFCTLLSHHSYLQCLVRVARYVIHKHNATAQGKQGIKCTVQYINTLKLECLLTSNAPTLHSACYWNRLDNYYHSVVSPLYQQHIWIWYPRPSWYQLWSKRHNRNRNSTPSPRWS